jgi:hypothetical protein
MSRSDSDDTGRRVIPIHIDVAQFTTGTFSHVTIDDSVHTYPHNDDSAITPCLTIEHNNSSRVSRWYYFDSHWHRIEKRSRWRQLVTLLQRWLVTGRKRREQRIHLPPCSRLAGFLCFFASRRTKERVLDPMLRDIQDEYCAALAAGSPAKAKEVAVRGAIDLIDAWRSHTWGRALQFLLGKLLGDRRSGAGSVD